MSIARGGNTHIKFEKCPKCKKKGYHLRGFFDRVKKYGISWYSCKYCGYRTRERII